MATSRMFLPLMFPDRTGSVFGSEFSELYDRMYLCVCRTRHDSDGAAQYGIYDASVTPFNSPVATLDYGAGGALGTVMFVGPGGSPRTHEMSSFLTVVGGPRHRKFTASDEKEYTWGWRTNTQDSLEEWTCVNSNGDTVAWYALGVPGEVYETSSGCAFGVEEQYPHLAVEFLASLLIMRYLATLDT
ncbi:hypothetical protein EDB84DRAFT_366262 [Lactarius hengduanensis]|nr:hypothetical protein EDB84DRAFT_366262 [Lactarius hengduanensis]